MNNNISLSLDTNDFFVASKVLEDICEETHQIRKEAEPRNEDLISEEIITTPTEDVPVISNEEVIVPQEEGNTNQNRGGNILSRSTGTFFAVTTFMMMM